MRTPAADITPMLNNVNARLSTRKSGIFFFFLPSFWPVARFGVTMKFGLVALAIEVYARGNYLEFPTLGTMCY